MPRPKHHYVPRFYLGRFSNPKGKITAYDRLRGKYITTNVKNVASETEYYTTIDASGEQTEAVEQFLSSLEGRVARALSEYALHDGTIDPRDREAVAWLLALQLVRTPRWRAFHQDMADRELRTVLAVNLVGRTREEVHEYLKSIYEREPDDSDIDRAVEIGDEIGDLRFLPSQNTIVKMMLNLARDVAPLLFEKPWVVYRTDRRSFFASDHPVVMWRQDSPELGIGVGTADKIYFPLDPYAVLSINAVNSGERKSLAVEEGDREEIRRINHLVAHNAARWIFHHPKHHEPLVGMSLPPRAPIANVNGIDVYEDESSWDVLNRAGMLNLARLRQQ